MEKLLTKFGWDDIVRRTQKGGTEMKNMGPNVEGNVRYQEDLNDVCKRFHLQDRSPLPLLLAELRARNVSYSISYEPDGEPLVRVGGTTRNYKNYPLERMLGHVIKLELFNAPTCTVCLIRDASRKIVVALTKNTADYCDECFLQAIKVFTAFSVEPI